MFYCDFFGSHTQILEVKSTIVTSSNFSSEIYYSDFFGNHTEIFRSHTQLLAVKMFYCDFFGSHTKILVGKSIIVTSLEIIPKF